MPRVPKDPETRARRNKASTAAELPAPESAELKKVKVPPLNAKLLDLKGAIRPSVQRWWQVIWREPMASRWLKSDIEVLYDCARLKQQIASFQADGKSIV